MIETIVHSSAPIGLIGGAPVSRALFAQVRAQTQSLVAADGGVATALAHQAEVRAVIGDMDSADAATLAQLPPERLHRVAEQDTTDFEKCLQRITAPVLVGAGFRGGRLDHELAALHGLMRFARQRCILLSDNDLVFLCPPSITLDLPNGTPLSLFPLAPVTGASAGLVWSFSALEYAPGVQIGTSNEVCGPVSLQMGAPAMLCILPSSALPEVMTALLAAPKVWPV